MACDKLGLVPLDSGVQERVANVGFWCPGRAVAAPQDCIPIGAEGATGFILTLISSCLKVFL